MSERMPPRQRFGALYFTLIGDPGVILEGTT